jgi:hypothetical protein
MKLLRANRQHVKPTGRQPNLSAAGNIQTTLFGRKVEHLGGSGDQRKGIGSRVKQQTQLCCVRRSRSGSRYSIHSGRATTGEVCELHTGDLEGHSQPA